MTEYQKNLILSAQGGNEEAFEEIIVKNSGLIWSAVRRFYNRGVSDEDLYQLGAMGLVKAVKRFDVTYDVEFSTYAVPMILGEIRRFLRDDGIIKVSRSAREKAAAIRRIKQEEGINEISKIAEKLEITYEEAIFALEATTPPESIDKEIYETDSKLKLGDIIPSKDEEDVRIEKMALYEAIESLSERDKKLITLRFFKELTQSQTAKILNIGQVQVSRLEKKIIGQIREKMTS